MSKITKRILSIILALVLAVSGVLSGIPGGGVVRGEETGEVESSVAEKVEDASTASLGADMDEWDVGAEVVGDVGSAFVEEKAEDNEEDNGFLFVSVLREIIEEKSHGGALCQEKANRNGTICSWRLPALASPSAGSAKSAAFPKTCSTGKPPVLATLPADAVHLRFLLRQ